MPVKKIEIPELGTVNLYKRRGIRSLRLTLSHTGDVRVSLPYWVPYAAATQFALSKLDWIKAQQAHVISHLTNGDHIGKAHRLRFIQDTNRDNIKTRITTDREIRVHHPLHLTSTHPDVQAAAQKACIRALKIQAEKLLPQRLRTLAETHSFDYASVSVRQLKSRWGSCTDKQHITLNCYLMQLPWHLIDYVLMHELMHTRIMAHGPTFWTAMTEILPNTQALRKEMKLYSPSFNVALS